MSGLRASWQNGPYKTNTKNNTKTRRTPRSNRYSNKKLFLCVFRILCRGSGFSSCLGPRLFVHHAIHTRCIEDKEEEDTRHFICSVCDVLWVIDAQVTRLRGLVIACQSASAGMSFLVAFSNALNVRNILERCMACCHIFLLSKRSLNTLNIGRTQIRCQKKQSWKSNKMFRTKSHGSVSVDIFEKS